jgi:phosphatidylglycerophosphatase A
LSISSSWLARANLRFLLDRPSHFLALGFGAGLSPVAPGTAGTLVAFPLYWVFARYLDPVPLLVCLVSMYLVGIRICGRTARALGVEDHRSIVWDEIVAFCMVLFFTPRQLLWQISAFALFRLLDAWKPGPIRAIEKRFRGGFGVMVDDLAAAFITVLCLALAKIALDNAGERFGF